MPNTKTDWAPGRRPQTWQIPENKCFGIWGWSYGLKHVVGPLKEALSKVCNSVAYKTAHQWPENIRYQVTCNRMLKNAITRILYFYYFFPQSKESSLKIFRKYSVAVFWPYKIYIKHLRSAKHHGEELNHRGEFTFILFLILTNSCTCKQDAVTSEVEVVTSRNTRGHQVQHLSDDFTVSITRTMTRALPCGR